MTELRDRELERLFHRHDDPELEPRVAFRGAIGEEPVSTRPRRVLRGALAAAALLLLLAVALLVVVARRPEAPAPRPAATPAGSTVLPVVFQHDNAVWWAPAEHLDQARWLGSGMLPSLSPDGRLVLAERPTDSSAYDVVLLEPARQDAAVVFRDQGSLLVQPVWAQDAPVAAVADDAGVVRIIDGRGALAARPPSRRITLTVPLGPDAAAVHRLAIAPDGGTVLVGGGRDDVLRWWVIDVATAAVHAVAMRGDLISPIWTTTGLYGAMAGRIVTLTRVAGTPEPWTARTLATIPGNGNLSLAGVSDDGRRIAYTLRCFPDCSQAGIYDRETDRRVGLGRTTALGIAPDGDRTLLDGTCDDEDRPSHELRLSGAGTASASPDYCIVSWPTPTTTGAPSPEVAAPGHDVLLVRRAVSGFSRVDLGSGAITPLPYPVNVGDANPAVIHTGNRFVWHGDVSVDDGLQRAAEKVPPDPQVRSDELLPATPGAFWRIELGPGNRSVTGAERVAVDTGRLLSADSFNGIPVRRGVLLRRQLVGTAGDSLILRDPATGRTTITDGVGRERSLVLPAGTTIADGMAISCVAPCATVSVQDLADGARHGTTLASVRLAAAVYPGSWVVSPDRTRIAALTNDGGDDGRSRGQVLEIDLRTRTARLLPDVDDLREPTLAWTADGTRLVVVGATGRVWEASAAGAADRRLVTTLPPPADPADLVVEITAS